MQYGAGPKMISLDDIDLSQRSFKVSRDRVSEEFRRSVKELGVLDPPLLYEEHGRLTVLFGLNRIHAARDAGYTGVHSRVTDTLDAHEYINQLIVKSMRNEIGPVGRIRALEIVAARFASGRDIVGKMQRWMKIPPAIAEDGGLRGRIGAFPGMLLQYLDYRNAGFRTIMQIAELSPGDLGRIARWAELSDMGMNAFRQITEMAVDIARRDGSLGPIDDSGLAGIEIKNDMEAYLFREVVQKRYPDYSSLWRRVERKKKEFSKRGFEVDFPKYFEGDRFSISFTVRRDDDYNAIKKRFESLPPDNFRELQDLL